MVRTRKSRRGGGPKTPRHLIRMINRVESGGQIKRGFDPPAIVTAPWWPATIIFPATGDATSFTAVDLIKQISKQFGFKDPKKLNARLMSVRVWGLDNQYLELKTYGLIGEGNLSNASDFGTTTRYSHVGWRYGRQFQNVVMSGDEQFKAFEQLFSVKTEGRWLAYISCLIQVSKLEASKEPVRDEAMTEDFVKLSVGFPLPELTTPMNAATKVAL